MGIFFTPDYEILHEMEIDGQNVDDEDENEDYTSQDDDENNDEGGDDTVDTGDEDTVDTSDSGNEGENDDYTDGAEDTDDNDTSGEGEDDDYTSGAEDTDSDDQNNSEDDNEDDYTADADTSEEGNTSDNGEEDGGDDTVDTDGEDGENNEDNSFEDLKRIESELFSNLSDEQIAIKNSELKERFIDLYSTIGSTLVRINDISKSDDNIEILKFVTDKLLELREMIDFNITTAYQTRTYIENNIIYQQCLSTLNAIGEIIASIPSPVTDDEEENIIYNSTEDENSLDNLENNVEDERLDVSDKMIESASDYNSYF